jgi:phage gp29-like protein
MYLFKNYAVKGWVGFTEVYGMPLRAGKYEPGAGRADRKALVQTARALGALLIRVLFLIGTCLTAY